MVFATHTSGRTAPPWQALLDPRRPAAWRCRGWWFEFHRFSSLGPAAAVWRNVQQPMRYSTERSGGSIRLSSITLIHKHSKEDTWKDHLARAAHENSSGTHPPSCVGAARVGAVHVSRRQRADRRVRRHRPGEAHGCEVGFQVAGPYRHIADPLRRRGLHRKSERSPVCNR
jgi:hypothetical protein